MFVSMFQYMQFEVRTHPQSQSFHLVLVLREHSSKAVGLLNQLVQRLALKGRLASQKVAGGVHVGAHAETAASLLTNGKLVTCE